MTKTFRSRRTHISTHSHARPLTQRSLSNVGQWALSCPERAETVPKPHLQSSVRFRGLKIHLYISPLTDFSVRQYI
jgi:hypothetical protein